MSAVSVPEQQGCGYLVATSLFSAVPLWVSGFLYVSTTALPVSAAAFVQPVNAAGRLRFPNSCSQATG